MTDGPGSTGPGSGSGSAVPDDPEELDDPLDTDADRQYESVESGGGHDAGDPLELGEDVAQQAATGLTGVDAQQHAGAEALASEGRLPG